MAEKLDRYLWPEENAGIDGVPLPGQNSQHGMEIGNQQRRMELHPPTKPSA